MGPYGSAGTCIINYAPPEINNNVNFWSSTFGVVAYSCTVHLIPYVAAVKTPNPVTSLYARTFYSPCMPGRSTYPVCQDVLLTLYARTFYSPCMPGCSPAQHLSSGDDNDSDQTQAPLHPVSSSHAGHGSSLVKRLLLETFVMLIVVREVPESLSAGKPPRQNNLGKEIVGVIIFCCCIQTILGQSDAAVIRLDK